MVRPSTGWTAWYTKAGSHLGSAAPAQDGGWEEAVEACAAVGEPAALRRLVALRRCVLGSQSPVLRGGAFMPGAATIQPAVLARGLRRVLLERGVVIHEGTTVTELDGERPGWLGGVGRGRTTGAGRACRAPGPRPARRSAAGRRPGHRGRSAVVALNAWAAAWPSFGRRLVTWSSYIVLTEPIPDRLADIGWTGGEGLADARFTLHYLRTTPDGRIAIGGGGGRAGFGGRIGPAFTDDARPRPGPPPACAGCSRRSRDVRIEDAWGGPIDITADHLPAFASVPERPIHFGHGYSGNGVAPSVVGGRILAAPRGGGPAGSGAGPAAGRGPAAGVPAGAVPSTPAPASSARRSSRREQLEERGRSVGPDPARAVTRLPRRLGYHLGPE